MSYVTLRWLSKKQHRARKEAASPEACARYEHATATSDRVLVAVEDVASSPPACALLRIIPQPRHGPQRPDCLAGVGGLEVRRETGKE